MYKKISDYGVIGDLHTISLIGLDGSIDWLCFPHIDSASVFSALLDDKRGGRFIVSPEGEYDSAQEYVKGTNILVTKFRTATGEAKVTDFMPVPAKGDMEKDEKVHELYRLVEVKKGSVNLKIVFEPKFDYARAETVLTDIESGVAANGGGEKLSLSSTHPMQIKEDCACSKLSLSAGDTVCLKLRYGSDKPFHISKEAAMKALEDTTVFWKSWLNKKETGRTVNLGEFKDMIERSALVLKLLSYSKTGAIAAAATTSLPEVIGGERNWDYRYTWVRDTSFTLQALFNLGHLSETEGYIRWLEKLISGHGADNLKIMYAVDGYKDLHEEELTHLDGYKGSKPVRVGNEAVGQRQMDIYGELMDAALKLSDYVGKIDKNIWPSLKSICDHVVKNWHEKDNGIWEVRGGPYHFVYSKVMCWVALDRGVTIAGRYGFHADTDLWEKTMAAIKKEVLERGYNKDKKAFVQHYETDALDASNLLIPKLGFLPYDDPRVVSTIEATRYELEHDGFLYRYRIEDGLPGDEGTFLTCTFWLIDSLIAQKRFDEARKLLKRMERVVNHLGLFSEEYDFNYNEALGNFPQAFTHIGYINSVVFLLQTEEGANRKKDIISAPGTFKEFFSDTVVLNNGEPKEEIAPDELAARLKNSINVLRGAFFDLDRGRIAYERMHDSDAYREYVTLSYNLKKMDLDQLKLDEEKLAFWINLYNVIVIHGVIELGVRDSVKEVRNFFKRVKYNIGGMLFSPDDIEHGILRCNKIPPNKLFRQFRRSDERLKYSLKKLDSRIHFALVCGSSSCPPIEVYTAKNLGEELTTAGEAFLNGGVEVYRDKKLISISRIFKWYGTDFGGTDEKKLKFIAPYLYNIDDRTYILENADLLKISYQEYDWRLNRGA